MGRVCALLLAAGLSQRMGEPKPLLTWRGQTLLSYQVSTLQDAGLSPILVVLGHRADELEAQLSPTQDLRLVRNPDYKQGRSTSVRAGVNALDPSQVDAVLVLNVDQPRPSALVSSVLQAHEEGGALITIPTYRGKGGHPVVFSAELLGELAHVSEATQGLKALVRRHESDINRIELGLEEALLDLNTEEEYRRAYALYGRG